MPPPPSLSPLTLIVATTPSLGLGYHGALPWPPLKADMAFFARITKRPPPLNSFHQTPNIPAGSSSSQSQTTINAVIMGRKTWESIPLKFRPLRGRINVVVSRQEGLLDGEEGEVLIRVGSIEEGLRRLQQFGQARSGDAIFQGSPPMPQQQEQFSLGRVFVIGGAEIYAAALAMDYCERILWTRIEKEWECDVWFPKGVLGEESGVGQKGNWVRRSEKELDQWCGDAGNGVTKEEGGVEFKVEMWERKGGVR